MKKYNNIKRNKKIDRDKGIQINKCQFAKINK